MRRLIFSLLVVSFWMSSTTAGSADDGATGITPSPTFTIQQSGKTVSVPVGRTFQVRLDGNPTTGYSWVLDPNGGNKTVKLVLKPEYNASPPARIGSGGEFTFKFEASSPGTTTLKFNYLRPWEKSVSPARTFNLTVVVTGSKR